MTSCSCQRFGAIGIRGGAQPCGFVTEFLFNFTNAGGGVAREAEVEDGGGERQPGLQVARRGVTVADPSFRFI